jgi:hypothetical protein
VAAFQACSSANAQNYFYSQGTMGADTSNGKVRYYWIGGFLYSQYSYYGYMWMGPMDSSANVTRVLPIPK